MFYLVQKLAKCVNVITLISYHCTVVSQMRLQHSLQLADLL